MTDGENAAVQAPKVDFDTIWARVQPARARINRPTPKPVQEADWLRLRVVLQRLCARSPSESSAPDLGLCEGYVWSAKEDTRAAELLDKNGHASLSVYHLQQAAEKGMKAFCLAGGIATGESLKRTHRTPQPLLTALASDYLGDMTSLFSRLANKDYRGTLRRVDRLVNSEPHALALLPFKSSRTQLGIEVLLRTLDAVARSQPLLDDKEEEVKTILAECLPEYKDAIMAFSVGEGGHAAVQCYILGALTFPHESPTRYPGGFIEPQQYDRNLGIVQAIPSLVERMPLMITSVEEVLRVIRTRGSSGVAAS